MRLYTHLNFGGNCEEAFRFYEKHLGGKITMMMKAGELPPEVKAPGSKNVPPKYFKPVRSSYLYLAVDSAAEAERIYRILEKGGQAGTPIAETFFATRFAQLRDRFGTLWTIIHERPRPQV